MSEPLLDVRDLRTEFHTDDGVVKAVDGVSFTVAPGQVLGIVGESGSGKSVTCLTLMGLNDPKFSKSSGEVLFRGEDLLKALVEPPPRRARQRDRDDLPGPDDVAEPGAQDRAAARRGGHACTRTSAPRRRTRARSSS